MAGLLGWCASGVLVLAVAWLIVDRRRLRTRLSDAEGQFESAYQRGRIDATRDRVRARAGLTEQPPPLPGESDERQSVPIYVPPPAPWIGDRWGNRS